MNVPRGFRAVGVKAGIKRSGKADLALLCADVPLAWALTSTQNILQAACVQRNRQLYASGAPLRALLINSGNANCATGQRGDANNRAMASAAAEVLELPDASAVLTASTGIIGEHLPMDKLQAAIPQLLPQLSDDLSSAAQAILTTDLVPKSAQVELPGGARIVGIAKGSGMIHPNMATMLAFVLTDAQISQDSLREIWPDIVDDSFNQLTVDGDTSPNDMAVVCSSQQLPADAQALRQGLLEVCQSLAEQIAADGEGASKLIHVQVQGAESREQARRAARAVVSSSLVKSAAHGNDPNWGRIVSAVGAAQAVPDLAKLQVFVQDVLVYHGEPLPFDAEALSAKMASERLLIRLDMASGEAAAQAWGCDLTADYVRINADYHT